MKFLWLLGTSALLAISVRAQTTDTSPALVQAIQRGNTAEVSRLLDSGVRPTATAEADGPPILLASLFGDAAMVDALLKRGTDPNQTDSAGATALMLAVPDIEKVRRLLERGANVDARSTNLGRTPFLIAAAYPGSVDVMTLLLAHGADLRAKDGAGFSALAMAPT
jgi:ankyrin repeat protein